MEILFSLFLPFLTSNAVSGDSCASSARLLMPSSSLRVVYFIARFASTSFTNKMQRQTKARVNRASCIACCTSYLGESWEMFPSAVLGCNCAFLSAFSFSPTSSIFSAGKSCFEQGKRKGKGKEKLFEMHYCDAICTSRALGKWGTIFGEVIIEIT